MLLLGLKRQTSQQVAVSGRNIAPARQHSVDSQKLTEAQRRLQIGQAIIVTKLDLFVIPGAVALARHQFGLTCGAVRTQEV